MRMVTMTNTMENISTRWVVDLLLYLNIISKNIVANGLAVANSVRAPCRSNSYFVSTVAHKNKENTHTLFSCSFIP